jgi:hypothetical protein
MWSPDPSIIITAEQRAAEAAAAARKAEFPNLEPDQFWFVVRASGHEQELRDWVASLNDPESPNHDPMAWAVASAKLDFAKFFERDHPLVEAARHALGMTAQQLDDLWKFAAS